MSLNCNGKRKSEDTALGVVGADRQSTSHRLGEFAGRAKANAEAPLARLQDGLRTIVPVKDMAHL